MTQLAIATDVQKKYYFVLLTARIKLSARYKNPILRIEVN